MHLICNRTDRVFAPRMVPGAPPPLDCPTGSVRIDVPPAIQFLDRDLVPPRDFKVAVAIDRELPFNMGGTLEMLYSQSLEQLFIQDLNLPEPLAGAYDPWTWDGFGQRARYSNVLARVRRRHAELGPVVSVSNGPVVCTRTGDDRSPCPFTTGIRDSDRVISMHAELTGSFWAGNHFTLGYGYAQARTLQSLTSADIVSAFGRNPTSVDLNRPGGRPSPFLRPHTVTFSLWNSVRDRWGATDIGINYRGMSGRPYSYVYMTDVNGDGFPGYGRARYVYNDLLYVPEGVTLAESPLLGPISRSLLHQLAGIEPCLEEARGRILERAACKGPWTNRFDLRAVRGLSTPLGTFEVSGDLINVLNLINSEWDEDKDVRPAVPILRIDSGADGDPQATYTGPLRRDADGNSRPILPYTVSSIDSRWQAQLGVRVRF